MFTTKRNDPLCKNPDIPNVPNGTDVETILFITPCIGKLNVEPDGYVLCKLSYVPVILTLLTILLRLLVDP